MIPTNIYLVFGGSSFMSVPLSQKQQQIFDYLKDEIRTKGYPPTVREICHAVKLRSTSTVHAHLEALEKKGRIRRSPTKNRSIEILEDNFYSTKEAVQVPIVGEVTAGLPILATENIEGTFTVSTEFVPNGDVFMLNVKGDSMIDAGIRDKDLIMVNQQPTASDGDIVVALLEDTATVKYFFRENHYIRLQPANASYSPIITNDCRILGKVVGLFRKY